MTRAIAPVLYSILIWSGHCINVSIAPSIVKIINCILVKKFDGNGPIFIKLWPGEFWLQISPSHHQTLPGHNSMNIGPLTSGFARKQRSWCRLCFDAWYLTYATSFDSKTRHPNIKLRRAINRWISVRCRRFLRVNRDRDVVYISMYNMEPKRRYYWRYGSAAFRMRNQPCLHTKISYFIETWDFLTILLFYYRVCIYLIHCKLLNRKTKRKGFIFPPSHGIPPKCKKKLGDVRGVCCM